MAKLVFGMNQSLDGHVDHMAFAPSPISQLDRKPRRTGDADSPAGRLSAVGGAIPHLGDVPSGLSC
jgi:hypothetical protein